jgi:hypothetical protein
MLDLPTLLLTKKGVEERLAQLIQEEKEMGELKTKDLRVLIAKFEVALFNIKMEIHNLTPKPKPKKVKTPTEKENEEYWRAHDARYFPSRDNY